MEQLCEEIMGGGTSNFRETQPIGHQTNPNFVTNCHFLRARNKITFNDNKCINTWITGDGMFSHDKQRRDVLRWGRVVITPALTY